MDGGLSGTLRRASCKDNIWTGKLSGFRHDGVHRATHRRPGRGKAGLLRSGELLELRVIFRGCSRAIGVVSRPREAVGGGGGERFTVRSRCVRPRVAVGKRRGGEEGDGGAGGRGCR